MSRHNLRRALRAALERAFVTEIIGQPECPAMLRWTLADTKLGKVMIHYFPPEVIDRDPHDHPWSFVTLVLRGEYRDESWFNPSFEARQASPFHIPPEGIKLTERLRAGAIRFRPADHLHIVETDEKGCWTLVISGPLSRDWGFVRVGRGTGIDRGRWFPFKEYVERWGGVRRCDAAEAEVVPVAFTEKNHHGRAA